MPTEMYNVKTKNVTIRELLTYPRVCADIRSACFTQLTIARFKSPSLRLSNRMETLIRLHMSRYFMVLTTYVDKS